mgnify:CR=1 FL=1
MQRRSSKRVVLLVDQDVIGYEPSNRSTTEIALPQDVYGDNSTLAALAARQWHSFESRWESSIEPNRDGWISVAIDDADVDFFERDRPRWEGEAGNHFLLADTARERYPMLQGGLPLVVGAHPGSM